MDPIFIVIIVLVAIVITLVIINLSIKKKLNYYNNVNEKITNLNVLQEFLDTIGKDSSTDNKLEIINNILIEKFAISYSTIVVFNGAEYIIKATNVDEKHWDIMKNLHNEEMFKDSITTATPKYVTINKPEEKLAYQKNEMTRAKSAMFFPLYIDNVYIGYWVIESNEQHAFDKTDTSILSVINDNIVSVLKTISYQNTIENIYRIDKNTGLNSAEYLYGKGKRTIDKFESSIVCMFKIINIENINKEYGREIGTELIAKVSNVIKKNLESNYIFVRYMGPKFAIVFSGADLDGVENIVKSMKEEVEDIQLEEKEGKSKKKKEEKICPKTNFVIATYYKGTGIEEVTKKLEEYLDECNELESNINCI